MIVARASDYDQNWFPYWIILCLRLMTFSPRLILPILSNRLISKNKFSGASFWPAAKSDKNGSTPFQIWLHCRRSSRSSFHHPTIAKHLNKSPGLVVMGGDSCFEGRGFESHFLAKHLNKSPGLVVMGGDLCFEGCGFEFRSRELDGHNIFSQIFVVRILMVVVLGQGHLSRVPHSLCPDKLFLPRKVVLKECDQIAA